MEPQTFTTNLSLDEIEQRLAGLENFDLNNGDGTSTVELAERGNEGTLFTTGKADRFFEDGLAEPRTALGG